MEPTAAAIEAANSRVRRASGLLRAVTQELAALTDGSDTVLGVTRVHDQQSADAARDRIALGVGRHGAVDVVVIARPTKRRSDPPQPT